MRLIILISSKEHLQMCILCHVIRAEDQFGCFLALKISRTLEPSSTKSELIEPMVMHFIYTI